MVKTKIEIFIGSDNNTHVLTKKYIDKTINIIKSFYSGFSVEIIAGYYNSIKEDCLKVTIFENNLKPLNSMVNNLKVSLSQDSILINKEKSNYQFM